MALEYLTWWLMSPGVASFLLLNVLVAAIVVTSWSQGGRARTPSTRRLCRSASSMVLDRLRSFSKHRSLELCYSVSPEAEELKQVSGAAPDRQLAVPEPATLAAISMMTENAEGHESAPRVGKSMNSDADGNGTCALGQEGRHAQEPMPSPPPAAPAVTAVTAETARVALVLGQLKDEEPATVAESVKRKHRAHVYAVEGKAELNARAEQFIRQFRQELKLQRLYSMLTGSAAPTSRELRAGCSI